MADLRLSRFVVALGRLARTMQLRYRQRALKHRETAHLLACDDYLLQDMGLKRFDGRIEAIDPARIKPDETPGAGPKKSDPLPLVRGNCRATSNRGSRHLRHS